MAYGQQGLAGGADGDHPPVIELKALALIDRARLGKLDKKGLATIAGQLFPAYEPGFIVKRHRVLRGVGVKMVLDGLCDMHEAIPAFVRTGNSVVPSAVLLPARRSAIRHRRALHRFPD